MRLTKASATGNDFILVDLLDASPGPAGARAAFVRAVCARHDGVGADGAAFLEPDAEFDFAWEFYNADGSRAEMCGNAARAVALYVAGEISKTELRFRTVVGPVAARVASADRVEVTLPAVAEIRATDDYVFVRAGVPHAVVKMPDLGDRTRLITRAHEIKALPEYRRDGVNVTFYAPRVGTAIDAITFERGVEDFTLSCGTGALAAAFASRAGEPGRTVEVRVPGGALSVVCTPDRPVLVGPARLVARIDWLDPRR